MGNLVSGRKISGIAAVLALIALAAFLIVGQFNSTAVADDDDDGGEKFIGFWMAVDPSDGGFNKLSITDNDGDGTYDLGLSETFVSTCGGGRATLSGMGEVNEAGDLVVPIGIQCKNDPDNDDDGALVGPFDVTFVVLGDNLIEFQVFTLRVPYHRISVSNGDSDDD